MVDLHSLRRTWHNLGLVDPMFAVLTNPLKKGRGWTEAEFFHTGKYEITRCLLDLHRRGIFIRRGRALDFGCGVGRLSQALCLHFDECIGIDIAPSMIEAAESYNRFGDRCRYVLNEQPNLRCVEEGSFDFIYSNIVLQHIRPELSMSYMGEFLRVLAPGGILVFQLPAIRKPEPARIPCDTPLPSQAMRARITAKVGALEVPAGLAVRIPLEITNLSDSFWPSSSDDPSRFRVSLGNHWRHANHQMLRFDDQRFVLPFDIPPGCTFAMTPVIRVPDVEGEKILEFDLVQEGVDWFSAHGTEAAAVHLSISRKASFHELVELPGMEMHGIPAVQVRALIEGQGGDILFCEPDEWAPDWIGYRYCVAKRQII